MPRPRKYTDEQMISALKETRGMVYLAAERIGCTADIIYIRAKTTPAVAECMKSERGKVVDTAEQKLFSAIGNGDPWAIQMALKTLGKDRGYVERQEFSGKDGGPIEVTHDAEQLRRLPLEELVRLYHQAIGPPQAGRG